MKLELSQKIQNIFWNSKQRQNQENMENKKKKLFCVERKEEIMNVLYRVQHSFKYATYFVSNI